MNKSEIKRGEKRMNSKKQSTQKSSRKTVSTSSKSPRTLPEKPKHEVDNKPNKRKLVPDIYANFENAIEAENVNIKKSRASTAPLWMSVSIVGTFLIGLTSVMFCLSSWWFFMGFVGVLFPLLFMYIQKDEKAKFASTKTFFVNFCAGIVAGIFWVLFIVTEHFGVGILATLFRAFQIIVAFLAVMLIIYFLLEYVTQGKTSIPFVTRMADKTKKGISKSLKTPK